MKKNALLVALVAIISSLGLGACASGVVCYNIIPKKVQGKQRYVYQRCNGKENKKAVAVRCYALVSRNELIPLQTVQAAEMDRRILRLSSKKAILKLRMTTGLRYLQLLQGHEKLQRLVIQQGVIILYLKRQFCRKSPNDPLCKPAGSQPRSPSRP